MGDSHTASILPLIFRRNIHPPGGVRRATSSSTTLILAANLSTSNAKMPIRFPEPEIPENQLAQIQLQIAALRNFQRRLRQRRAADVISSIQLR